MDALPSYGRDRFGASRNRGQLLRRSEQRYLRLLGVAFLPILLMPFTSGPDRGGPIVLALVFSLLIAQSLDTLTRQISPRLVATIGLAGYRLLGMVTLVALWIRPLHGQAGPELLRQLTLTLLSLFFLITSVRLVQQLARAVRVNALVMAGGAAGYLLLGITGGVLATVTQVAVPGSFRFSHGAAPELLLDRLTYFSFVTLGGLGLGDIVPGNAVGERFVILLSVASTLYVALLVGILLGRFIASQEQKILASEHLMHSAPEAAAEGLDPGGV